MSVETYDDPQNVEIQPAQAGDLTRPGSFVSSIDVTSPEGGLQAFAAMGDPVSLSDVEDGTVINLMNYIVRDATFADVNTGETRLGVAVYLVDESGQSYITVSSGIFTRLSELVNLVPSHPWGEKPLPIRVKMKDIGKGRRVRTFNLA